MRLVSLDEPMGVTERERKKLFEVEDTSFGPGLSGLPTSKADHHLKTSRL